MKLKKGKELKFKRKHKKKFFSTLLKSFLVVESQILLRFTNLANAEYFLNSLHICLDLDSQCSMQYQRINTINLVKEARKSY